MTDLHLGRVRFALLRCEATPLPRNDIAPVPGEFILRGQPAGITLPGLECDAAARSPARRTR